MSVQAFYLLHSFCLHSRSRRVDVAYKMLENETTQLASTGKAGATSMGRLGGKASHNHYSLLCANGLDTVAGIRVDGMNHLSLPRTQAERSLCQVHYESIYGRVESSYRLKREL